MFQGQFRNLQKHMGNAFPATMNKLACNEEDNDHREARLDMKCAMMVGGEARQSAVRREKECTATGVRSKR